MKKLFIAAIAVLSVSVFADPQNFHQEDAGASAWQFTNGCKLDQSNHDVLIKPDGSRWIIVDSGTHRQMDGRVNQYNANDGAQGYRIENGQGYTGPSTGYKGQAVNGGLR